MLILKTAGESELNVNCWNRDAWMNALHCTHFACSTVTLRPLLLMKQVAICKEEWGGDDDRIESAWKLPPSP